MKRLMYLAMFIGFILSYFVVWMLNVPFFSFTALIISSSAAIVVMGVFWKLFKDYF